jgi:hypothetical protein
MTFHDSVKKRFGQKSIHYDVLLWLPIHVGGHIVWKVSSAPQQPKEDPCLVFKAFWFCHFTNLSEDDDDDDDFFLLQFVQSTNDGTQQQTASNNKQQKYPTKMFFIIIWRLLIQIQNGTEQNNQVPVLCNSMAALSLSLSLQPKRHLTTY